MVRGTMRYAVLSFPMSLLGAALAVVRAAAFATSVLGVGVAVIFAALWLWRQTPNLPPFVWAGLGAAFAAHLLSVLLAAAGDALRGARFRLDPRAGLRAHVVERARNASARYEDAVYRSLLRVPAAPQHPSDP